MLLIAPEEGNTRLRPLRSRNTDCPVYLAEAAKKGGSRAGCAGVHWQEAPSVRRSPPAPFAVARACSVAAVNRSLGRRFSRLHVLAASRIRRIDFTRSSDSLLGWLG